jgi:pimeloyl-ACP methyl ester carboxylesterase
LFVHGFPSFWYCWRAQMEHLRTSHRVIAIDAPGAGLSAKPIYRGAYRIEQLAGRLDRLIAELAPGEKISLVGHDWGGALAWSYAKWNSDRIARLAVFSAPPFDLMLKLLKSNPAQRELSGYIVLLKRLAQGPSVQPEAAAGLYDVAYQASVSRGLLTPAEGELFRTALAEPGALRGGAQWYAANIPEFDEIHLERDSWPDFGSPTPVPAMLVVGTADRTFVPEMAIEAREHAATLEIVTLNGVAHWTQFERPDLANSALDRFLAGF